MHRYIATIYNLDAALLQHMVEEGLMSVARDTWDELDSGKVHAAVPSALPRSDDLHPRHMVEPVFSVRCITR